jgi:hypothetical protein
MASPLATCLGQTVQLIELTPGANCRLNIYKLSSQILQMYIAKYVAAYHKWAFSGSLSRVHGAVV